MEKENITKENTTEKIIPEKSAKLEKDTKELAKKRTKKESQTPKYKEAQKKDFEIREKRPGVSETNEMLPEGNTIIPPKVSGFGLSKLRPKTNSIKLGETVFIKKAKEISLTPDERLTHILRTALDPQSNLRLQGRVTGQVILANDMTGEKEYVLICSTNGGIREAQKRQVLINIKDFVLPMSDSDFKPINLNTATDQEKKSYMTARVGAEIDFCVIGLDEERPESGYIYGSRKMAAKFVLEQKWYQKSKAIGERPQFTLREGAVAEARVVATMPAGIVVELFGLEAFIPSKELSYTRISSAAEHFSTGTNIRVLIKKVNRLSYQINTILSHKETKPDTTKHAIEQLIVSAKLKCAVTNVLYSDKGGSTKFFVSYDGILDIQAKLRTGLGFTPVIGDNVFVVVQGKNIDEATAWGEIVAVEI